MRASGATPPAGYWPTAPIRAPRAKPSARAGGAGSFETVAREWFAKHSPRWAETCTARVRGQLTNDLLPWLGPRPVGAIAAPELLAVARRLEARGALYSAHRPIRTAGQIFRYAVATGRAERDPSNDLRGALPPAGSGHLAAVIEPPRVAERSCA